MSRSNSLNKNLLPKFYLAIDQGGQSTRVAVYDETGQQICVFSAVCNTRRYVENNSYNENNSSVEHIEQNPEEILSGIHKCFTDIKKYLGDDIKHIVAAGFAGQGSSLLCWDKETGEALSPIVSWQDIRGKSFLEKIDLTNETVTSLTGLRLSPHYGASKMRWCLDHYPQVQAAQKNYRLCIGPIVSYLLWHLAGKVNLVDPGHAQRTLLWNLLTKNWDESLMQTFGIAREYLPQCLHHNSHFGNLLLDNTIVPFIACARDQGASVFARGLAEHNACYINMGTGAFIQRISKILQAPEELLVSPLRISENKKEENYYAWEATVNGAAAAIPFMQEATGLSVNVQDMETALALELANKQCYFLNAVGGLSAPYWRTDLMSEFSENISSHEKILAWLESVIFQIMVNVKLIHSQNPVEKIIISGGFSNANKICQKMADLSGLSVCRSDNADATLQGIACMTTGLSPLWKPVIKEDVFFPEENILLQKRFAQWQEAMNNWLK
jgi:glycerol kinase